MKKPICPLPRAAWLWQGVGSGRAPGWAGHRCLPAAPCSLAPAAAAGGGSGAGPAPRRRLSPASLAMRGASWWWWVSGSGARGLPEGSWADFLLLRWSCAHGHTAFSEHQSFKQTGAAGGSWCPVSTGRRSGKRWGVCRVPGGDAGCGGVPALAGLSRGCCCLCPGCSQRRCPPFRVPLGSRVSRRRAAARLTRVTHSARVG